MKKRLIFIDVMKVIAIVLITNSHFKHDSLSIYEGNLTQFAIGGALGCSLFFFCSGFTGMLGTQRPFLKDIFHKIIRIYPTIWIFLLTVVLIKTLTIGWKTDFIPTFEDYILLEQFWFLQALLIFYVVFWFVRKYLNKPKMLVALMIFSLAVSATFYFIYSHSDWMIDHPREHLVTFPYYFSIMLLGALCSKTDFLTKNIRINNQVLRLFLVIASSAMVYGYKFIVERKEWLPNDAQLIFPLLLMLACLIVYVALFHMQHCYKFMTFIAALTLEIYIVQIECIHFCADYPFPLRFLMVVAMILIAAWLLQLVRNFIVKTVEKGIGKWRKKGE